MSRSDPGAGSPASRTSAGSGDPLVSQVAREPVVRVLCRTSFNHDTEQWIVTGHTPSLAFGHGTWRVYGEQVEPARQVGGSSSRKRVWEMTAMPDGRSFTGWASGWRSVPEVTAVLEAWEPDAAQLAEASATELAPFLESRVGAVRHAALRALAYVRTSPSTGSEQAPDAAICDAATLPIHSAG